MRRELLDDPVSAAKLARLVQLLLLGTRRTQRLRSVHEDGDELHVWCEGDLAFTITVRPCEEEHS